MMNVADTARYLRRGLWSFWHDAWIKRRIEGHGYDYGVEYWFWRASSLRNALSISRLCPC